MDWRGVAVIAGLIACSGDPPTFETDPSIGDGDDSVLLTSECDFGRVPIGQEHPPREVFLSNRGEVPIEIYDMIAPDEAAGFYLGTSLVDEAIPPDTEVSFLVRWLPRRVGSATAPIFVVSSVSPEGSPREIVCVGEAISGALRAEPERIDVPQGDRPVRTPIVLTNTGEYDLDLTAVELEGDPGVSIDLDEGRNGALPLKIAPVDPSSGLPRRTLFVEWDPEASDGSREATLALVNSGYETRRVEIPVVIAN